MTRSASMGRALAIIGVASLALTACGGGEKATPQGTGKAPAGAGFKDGVLTVGTLLPQTGSLATLGPQEFAGVDLAINEINAAGGVLGKPVVKHHTDSGDTSTNLASQSVDKLLAQKSDVVIGAASSSVSLSVIDKITNAGSVHFSPANTSDELTTYKDKGLYFRTAPPDKLQGRVLGNLVVEDGNDTVGILALQDSYGTGLADNAEKAMKAGGAEVVEKVVYDPKAADYSADVAKIKAKNPKAIVLIGFEETVKVIDALVKQGLTSDKYKWYMVDGNLSNKNFLKFPKGTLKGVKGTLPGAASPEDFKKKLLAVDPKLTEFSYGPESYDATILTALAAEAAKSDSGKDIATKLIEVSKGGEKCKDYKTCLEALKAGKDIDFDGVSGPIEFNDVGDPAEATIGIYQYGEDNKYPDKAIKYLSGKIAG